MIHFDKVSKIYSDKTVALDNITFKIDPGEFISIVGHSGAGKTTLTKMLMAEEKPTKGKVFLESVNIHALPRKHINEYRRRIGVVFQDFRLLSGKTVFENIAYAMEVAGREDKDVQSDVPYVLKLVDLEKKMWNYPHELSGGEKQRVAIARAIVNQPDIIIADEPTGNLDPINTYDIVQILKKINDLGTIIILTTHNKGVVDSIKRRVITLDRGKIVRDDPQGNYVL